MKTNHSPSPLVGLRRWTVADMPSQVGRLAIVTGTGGLGFETALALAKKGADLIVAGRNPQKGADAVSRIRKETPNAIVGFEPLDLADLKSISKFGEIIRRRTDRLDLLINNAGVMTPPTRLETQDGFELQFGTNYLGHFALTAELLPVLRNGRNSRVVTLSSIAARQGKIDFDDLQAKQGYRPMPVYAQSKLACLMFALELQRRSERERWGITSIGAHPGLSRTDLLYNSGMGRITTQGVLRSLLWFLFQPVPQGALPTLFAATSPDAEGGQYYGPARLGETRGGPALAAIPQPAQDLDAAARLWEVSERLVGKRLSGSLSVGGYS